MGRIKFNSASEEYIGETLLARIRFLETCKALQDELCGGQEVPLEEQYFFKFQIRKKFPNTLYPRLRELKRHGLIESVGPGERVFRLSRRGIELLNAVREFRKKTAEILDNE